MVRSGSVAKAHYLDGIRAVGGASAYHACGDKAATGGVKGVAECMHGLKKGVSEEVWASKYESAYEGR